MTWWLTSRADCIIWNMVLPSDSQHCPNASRLKYVQLIAQYGRVSNTRIHVTRLAQSMPERASLAALYINLYSPHNTVESTDRVADINRREKKNMHIKHKAETQDKPILTTSMNNLNNWIITRQQFKFKPPTPRSNVLYNIMLIRKVKLYFSKSSKKQCNFLTMSDH